MSDQTLTCHNYWCNYKTTDQIDNCPKCGRAMVSGDTFKLLGVILTICGFILAGAGGALLIFAAPKMTRGGLGGQAFAWGIFSLLLVMGLIVLASGITQMISGRRNQSMMTVFVVLVVVTLAIGGLVRSFL